MTERDEITIADIVKRYEVTMTVERVTPLLEPTRKDGRGRCPNCHASYWVRGPKGGQGLKHGHYLRRYECSACSHPLFDAAETEYRITLHAKSGMDLSSPYSMGSAYMFGDGPDVDSVLDSLRSDASLWQDYDVDDFVSEFCGIDPDAGNIVAQVRKGEESYRQCGETFKGLRHLLGDAGREELLRAEGL